MVEKALESDSHRDETIEQKAPCAYRDIHRIGLCRVVDRCIACPGSISVRKYSDVGTVNCHRDPTLRQMKQERMFSQESRWYEFERACSSTSKLHLRKKFDSRSSESMRAICE